MMFPPSPELPELPRSCRQLNRLLRPVDRHGRRSPGKIERYIEGSRQQVRSPEFSSEPVGYQAVDHLPAHSLEIYAGRFVNDPYTQPRRVQVDCYRHRELEGLQVDLCANLRHFANGDPRNSTGAPTVSPRTDPLKISW